MSDTQETKMSDITNAEAIEMMNRCKQEIILLRAEIERLSPKAHAYDSITTILGLLPKKPCGMGEDMVWLLTRRINELTPAKERGS